MSVVFEFAVWWMAADLQVFDVKNTNKSEKCERELIAINTFEKCPEDK